MTDRRTDLTKMLVRQGLRGGSAGTETTRGMTAPGAAMDRARRQLPATGREELSPMHGGGMREAHAYLDELEAAGTEAPALVRWEARKEPSPGGAARPVLRMVYSSSRRRPTRYAIGPRLVLIKGGKA